MALDGGIWRDMVGSAYNETLKCQAEPVSLALKLIAAIESLYFTYALRLCLHGQTL